MRRIWHLGLCAIFALSLNCAITDYGTITDNNQIRGKRAGVQPVINTKGKAHIRNFTTVTIWPDGTDELLNFVDQKADGTAVLTTYNNFSTGSEPTFHDDTYCNTDRTGCSIYTAPDDNDCDLRGFDVFDGTASADKCFDGTFHSNCSGARSLSILVSTGRYYGECGRRARSRLDVASKVRLLNLGRWARRYGIEGMLFDFDASNTSVVLTDETGYSEVLPFPGATTLWHAGDRSDYATLDFRDARLAGLLDGYASWLERRDPAVTRVTLTYHGVPIEMTLGQNPEQGIDFHRVLERSRTAF